MLHHTSEAHKKWKRAAAWALALLLAAGSLPLQALAGTYNVSNGQEMYDSWNDANQSSGSAHDFYMTENINMSGYELNVQEGNSYYIGSAPGENNTISDVSFTQSDSKGGDVTINANVTGTDRVLEVSGDKVEVTVNKNVTQTDTRTPEYDAVNVDGADVTIKGSVTAEGIGVMVSNDADVTIKGNVTSEEGKGVLAYSDSTVKVGGNVTAEDLAVHAYDAAVSVSGSVTSDEGRGIAAKEGTVTVGKNVTSVDDAIVAHSNSTVTVQGNVTRANDGTVEPVDYAIVANGDSKVTVGGSVTSNDGGMLLSDSAVTVKVDVTANGQTSIVDGAVVSIGDDFISEPNSTTIGKNSGVFVKDSELVVTDDMQTPLLNAMDDSDVYIGGDLKAKSVAVGSGDPTDASDTEDTTKLRTGDIYWNKNSYNTSLHANGHSNTTVYGSVFGDIYASDTATVNVTGTGGYTKVEDEGFVQTHLSNVWTTNPKIYYNPNDPSANDDLVALCRGYFEGSQMDDHLDSVHDAIVQANKDITSKMNFWSALLVSLTKHDDVLKDKYLKGINTNLLTNLNSYNDASVKAFNSAKEINSYEVNMYKANLASALKDIDNQSFLEAERKEIKNVAKLIKDLNDLTSGINVQSLSKEAQKALKGIVKNGTVSAADAENFLVKFGYYAKGSDELADASRRMSDMYAFSKQLGEDMETINGILTAVDFAEYWATNYENQVLILDNMLDSTEMPPEQFLAMVELRQEYANKFYGTARKLAVLVVDKGVDKAVEAAFQPLALAEIGIDLIALVTGVDGYVDGLHNGSAMVNMLPNMYNAYEEAIKKVRDGDSSDKAIEQVKTSFVLLKETLKNLSLSIKEVDKNLAKTYQDMYNDLKYLDIGETM